MNITFLLTRRVPDVPSPVLIKVYELLEAAGHHVDRWIPEDRALPTDVTGPDEDPNTLYVLKSHTELALSYAGALHLHGARLLNPYDRCVLAQDKVTAGRILADAGVPTPSTWLIGSPAQAAPLLEGGPLIIKPHRGHRGAGVYLVHTATELDAIEGGHVPLIAQRHVPGPGEDLKVYVAGDTVYAVRKSFDEMSFSRPGRPVPVTAEVHAIAQRVRTAFGLDLFGIDIIESPDGPQVVDVNYFPGYKGCPEPEKAIADVILTHVASWEDALVGAGS